jgi:PPOX class probable F420-dependent enzyme
VTPEEIDTFLGRAHPALIGVVATARNGGGPHAVPVWYSWDGHTIRIWTTEDRLWVRNLSEDSRVAFSVHEPGPPYGAVTMHGRAEIRTNAADLDDDIRGITRRYLDETDVHRYIATWARLRTVVRIHPTTLRAWSRGY